MSALVMLAAESVTEVSAGGPVGQSAIAPLLRFVLELGLVTLVVGMVLCVYRLMRGPTLADRVMATDTLALEVTGLVILLSMRLETAVFFDMALAVAIISFVSTVAFAQYIGGTRGREEDEQWPS